MTLKTTLLIKITFLTCLPNHITIDLSFLADSIGQTDSPSDILD